MHDLLKFELRKLYYNHTLGKSIIFLSLFAVFLYWFQDYFVDDPDTIISNFQKSFNLSFYVYLFGLLSGLGIFTEDYQQRTIMQIVTNHPQRFKIYLSKLLVALGLIVILCLYIATLNLIAVTIFAPEVLTFKNVLSNYLYLLSPFFMWVNALVFAYLLFLLLNRKTLATVFLVLALIFVEIIPVYYLIIPKYPLLKYFIINFFSVQQQILFPHYENYSQITVGEMYLYNFLYMILFFAALYFVAQRKEN